jgi:hypothetical protein
MNFRYITFDLFKRICFALFVAMGSLALLVIGEPDSAHGGLVTQEMSQSKGRILKRKPWRFEPVRIISATTKHKGKVELGKSFDEEDDWLDGFKVTVVNNSDKVVTAVTVEMIFRREPSDTRPPVGEDLHFSHSPFQPEYARRHRDKLIEVGGTAELELVPQNYAVLRQRLEREGYTTIKQVELVIREVGFEDGSALLSGTLWVQDPSNPGDPTKKIRVEENVKSRFPAVDYDAPEPADPAERTKRRNKGKRFDHLGGVRMEPTRNSSALLNHWDSNLAPLPVAQSNAVVIAKTLSRGAFLSNDKGAVYTELSVKVDEVLKTDNDSVGKGSLIDINRLGGVVRYRTGEESLFMIVGQNMPEVGKRYVFFLKALDDSEDFQLITGYELAPSGVNALDAPGQFQRYNGVDEPTFLNELRRAVGEIKP